MHLLPGVAMKPNLELKTRPKQLLGSLPLVIALPALSIPHSVSMHDYVKYARENISLKKIMILPHNKESE